MTKAIPEIDACNWYTSKDISEARPMVQIDEDVDYNPSIIGDIKEVEEHNEVDFKAYISRYNME